MTQWPEEDKFQNPPKEFEDVPLVHLVTCSEFKWIIMCKPGKKNKTKTTTLLLEEKVFNLDSSRKSTIMAFNAQCLPRCNFENLFPPYISSIALPSDVMAWPSLCKKGRKRGKGKTKHLLKFHNLSQALWQHCVDHVVLSSQPSKVLHFTEAKRSRER